MVLGLIIVSIIIVILETPGLVKKRLWKELVVFFIVLSLGMIYSIGQQKDWSLPNPERDLEYMVEPFLTNLNVELFSQKTD